MSHAWSHVFLNLRHKSFKRREDWCEWWTKIEANLNFFKTSKKDCILSKSNFFSQKFIGSYVESDKKIKILTIGHLIQLHRWICRYIQKSMTEIKNALYMNEKKRKKDVSIQTNSSNHNKGTCIESSSANDNHGIEAFFNALWIRRKSNQTLQIHLHWSRELHVVSGLPTYCWKPALQTTELILFRQANQFRN